MKKRIKKKPENLSGFFDTSFQGLPKDAVKRFDKNGRRYYLAKLKGDKLRRISKDIYFQVKEAKVTNKKKKTKSKVIELPAELHRAFLSFIKDKIFNANFSVLIQDIRKTYFKNGSFELFNSLRNMYNNLIKGSETYATDSNDLLYTPYVDVSNNQIIFRLDEITEYSHQSGSELKLNTNYLKQFF